MRQSCLAIFLALVAIPAAADDDRVLQQVPATEADAILSKLKTARPDFEYLEVRHAPIDGLYQVQVVGGRVLFTDENADMIIYGDLYSIENGAIRPYEHPSVTKARAEAMAQFSPEDQIVFSPQGETRAYINVFTDTTCGYCRKLHNEIEQINALGIEVRYLAYPREGLNSLGYEQLVTAWCSDDPQSALTQMKQGTMLAPLDCEDNPVAEQYEFGQMIGVGATPTLVMTNGQLLPGYVPAEELARILGLK